MRTLVDIPHRGPAVKRVDRRKKRPAADQFKALRSSIWEIADDTSLSESEIIQRLLDIVGPAFGVSRACFNTRTGKNFVTTHEWHAPGVSASIGALIPVWLVKIFIKETHFEVTVDALIKKAPVLLRSTIRRAIRAIVDEQDIEAMLVVPYRTSKKQLDTIISFDICRGRKVKQGWSQQYKDIIPDILRIISIAISRRRVQEDLSESEMRYQTLFNNISDIVILFERTETMRGKIIEANTMAVNRLGIKRDVLIKRTFGSIVTGFDDLVYRSLANGGHAIFETDLRVTDGSRIPVEVKATAIMYGERPAIIALARDISARRAAQKKAEEAFRSISIVNDINSRFLAGDSLDDIIAFTCGRFKELYGFTDVDVSLRAGADAFIYKHSTIDKRTVGAVERFTGANVIGRTIPLFDGSRIADFYRGRAPRAIDNRKDIALFLGDLFPPEKRILRALSPQAVRMMDLTRLYLVPFLSRGETAGHFGFFHTEQMSADDTAGINLVAGKIGEIIERKRFEEELSHLAHHDALTGLGNRKAFFEALDDSIKLASRSKGDNFRALLFIDLDNFKEINDIVGHLVGDQLLVSIADRIVKTLRTTDRIFRLAGDEFTVILTHIAHEEDAAQVAGKMIDALRTPFMIAGNEAHISASIGISLYPRDADNGPDLVKNADIAMYEAKKTKAPYSFYTDEMNERTYRRIQVLNELRGAVGRDELELYYQPIVNRAGCLAGAEALIRWKNRSLGFVSPVDFIPIAEDSGLIKSIGAWVIARALADAPKLSAGGVKNFFLAVNISGRQFADPQFVTEVKSILKNAPAGIDLKFEITENTLIDDPDKAQETMDAIRALGISFAIDDFGTGYSSLNYLTRFPVSHLKIDRSFVMSAGIETNMVIKGIITLAHNLGMQVVAEGIETDVQRDLLSEMRCDYMQGYLYSKPVAVADFAALVSRLTH